MYRSSTGALDHFDDAPPSRGGERWDRDRFERMARRGPPPPREVHEDFRFSEHDRFPGGGRRDVEFRDEFERRGPRVMERERETFREDERSDPRRRHHEMFAESTPSEVANRALAPYRRKSVVERDFDVGYEKDRPRRPARPQYIRRQSSLDTFDRKPMPRYGDLERPPREEWRPPVNMPIPLPIRERRRSPPRYREEFEEERFVEREDPRRPERVEEYREVEVHRSKSRRRRSPSRSHATRSVARSSSSSSFEEVKLARADWGKKGKTRLPKRLCKQEAVTELGYPYIEEVSRYLEQTIGLR